MPSPGDSGLVDAPVVARAVLERVATRGGPDSDTLRPLRRRGGSPILYNTRASATASTSGSRRTSLSAATPDEHTISVQFGSFVSLPLHDPPRPHSAPPRAVRARSASQQAARDYLKREALASQHERTRGGLHGNSGIHSHRPDRTATNSGQTTGPPRRQGLRPSAPVPSVLLVHAQLESGAVRASHLHVPTSLQANLDCLSRGWARQQQQQQI